MIAFTASAIAIAFSLMFPEVAVQISGPIFLLSILVLGMPHGVVDPLILFSSKNSNKWLGITSKWKSVSIYLSIAAAYGIVWHFYPAPSLWFFLILTALHWGTSEYKLTERPLLSWIVLGVSRGGLVVLGVLALQTEGSYQVIQSIAGQDAQFLSSHTLNLSFLSCCLIHFTALFITFRKKKHDLLLKILDSAMIIILLATTPALLGMAIYYMFFHGERYYRVFTSEYKPLLYKSHLICLSLFLALSIIYFINPDATFTNVTGLPAYFMVLAALTLPHSILVFRVQERVLNHPPQNT